MGAEQWIAFGFGALLLIALLLIALKLKYPTDFQYLIMRVLLALASACVAIFITGFLRVQIKHFIEAGGALAVFVIVYFRAPAALPQAAKWIELKEAWKELRDIHEEPERVNQDDAVHAINAVNLAGKIIAQQPTLLNQFKSEYREDFCNLYKKFMYKNIPIHHKNRTSKELLTRECKELATRLGCTK